MKIARILLATVLAMTYVTVESHAAEPRSRHMTAENSKPKAGKKKTCRTVEKKAKDKQGRIVLTRTQICK